MYCRYGDIVKSNVSSVGPSSERNRAKLSAIGSIPTFLYFDLYLYSAYAAHYVYCILLNCCTESRIVANDDDEENDYEDSFIDDEGESSSCEPSEHDDSDWHESDDEETSDEDVGELLAEARGFARKRKS